MIFDIESVPVIYLSTYQQAIDNKRQRFVWLTKYKREYSDEKYGFVLALTIPFGAYAAEDSIPTPESITSAQVLNTQGSETYSYVRCWYRTDASRIPLLPTGNGQKRKMVITTQSTDIGGLPFLSKTCSTAMHPQSEIKERCEQTLDIQHGAADITYFTADNRFSYNHSIWTNDNAVQANTINRIVTFGDSLSDTGNLFNGSQWVFER